MLPTVKNIKNIPVAFATLLFPDLWNLASMAVATDSLSTSVSSEVISQTL